MYCENLGDLKINVLINNTVSCSFISHRLWLTKLIGYNLGLRLEFDFSMCLLASVFGSITTSYILNTASDLDVLLSLSLSLEQ